jgi:hypothetical protein
MLGKPNRYLTEFSILLMMAALIAGMIGCVYNPPPSEDLEIRDWYDLDAIRNNLKGNHILMNDLDSTTPGYDELAGPTANAGKGWQPIGLFTPHGPTCCIGFAGTFDGQGYEIRDLFINRPDEDDVGLFKYVDRYYGIVEDIGVTNVTVIGGNGVGGLVGWNDYGLEGANGIISNSYSIGSATGNWGVGGLVGQNYENGTTVNSYSTGTVTGNYYVGGLVGSSGDTVINSFWDTQTSGQATSDGGRGTGKTTAEMKSIATFSSAGWNITAVTLNQTNPTYIWNIVDGVTYPFLSWQA